MRALITTAILVLFALGSSARDEKKYRSKEGMFAIQFPTGAKVKTDTKEEGVIKAIITSATVMGADYSVNYVYIPVPVKDIQPQKLLDESVKNAVATSKGKLLESKAISFGPDKHPGRDILIDKEGNKLRAKFIVAESRLYVFAVFGSKDFATSKEAANFLESFELIK